MRTLLTGVVYIALLPIALMVAAFRIAMTLFIIGLVIGIPLAILQAIFGG